MWQSGSWSELPGPPGCNINSTVAADVSDDGIIVGSEGWCWGSGVVWQNGNIRSLASACALALPGVGGGSAHAIAATPGGRHIIAGRCGLRPAVFYDDGRGDYQAALLPLLPGDTEGAAVDINPSGQVVGNTRSDPFAGPAPLHAVRWDVTFPNTAPTAHAGSLVVSEDTPADGLLTATDMDDVNLTYRVVTNGTKGAAAVTDAATGAFIYTPSPDANGADSFTFAVSDGSLESASAVVDVNISPVNDAPVAQDGAASANAGATVGGVLVAIDIDSPALSYSVATNGTKGTALVTNAATGAYAYAANPGASGLDTFTFRASDGVLGSNEATVTVTISNPCAAHVNGLVAVTRSGFIYHPGTRRFHQTVRITNTSASALNGPFALVLDDLSANAALLNASGLTSCIGPPAGSPYIEHGATLLEPGANLTLILQFTNPSKAGISYATRVLAGSGAR
jgi:hypothetical protein